VKVWRIGAGEEIGAKPIDADDHDPVDGGDGARGGRERLGGGASCRSGWVGGVKIDGEEAERCYGGERREMVSGLHQRILKEVDADEVIDGLRNGQGVTTHGVRLSMLRGCFCGFIRLRGSGLSGVAAWAIAGAAEGSSRR